MLRLRHLLLLLTGLALSDTVVGQPAEPARYEVVFQSTWSALTHPVDFPSSNPHFSGLIGGTHNGDVVFWMPGDTASQGIEDMAELGSKIALTAEVESAIGDGTAEFVLSGGGINPSPGARSLTFEISPEKPLVTLVTMVAPSPDWFVGVHDLSMIEGDDWRDTVTVTLDIYDAGTDSGPSYASPNDDTDPPEPIAILNSGPFAESTVMGTFTFTRQEPVGTSDDTPVSWQVVGPYPNPSSGRFSLDVYGAQTNPIRVAIHDITGRIVSRQQLAPHPSMQTVDIDVSRFSKGVYIVRMNAGDRIVTRPVVVVE